MAAFRFYRVRIPAKVVITALMLALTVTMAEGQCSIPCETITIPDCQGLSYTQTGFPNYFDHPSQAVATPLSEIIPAVVGTSCYAQSKELLCGTLVPECGADGLIFPTRTMCNDFLAGCTDTIRGDPTALAIIGILGDCSWFPEAPNDPRCNSGGLPPVTLPPVTPPEMDMVSTTTGGGLDKCPDGMAKCAGISINQSHVFMLTISLLVILIMQQLN